MTITSTQQSVAALREALHARITRGMRFAGVFAARRDGGITLCAHVTSPGGIDTLEAPLPPGAASYPALTPVIDAAFWYERVIHDETGKHRGIAARFSGMSVSDGVLLAERAEGIASVAHALAYCHAVETIAGCEIPGEAALARVVHAELERIANHLDVATRLADASGLAVATARFALHKERVMRLVSGMCGNRFCRGVIVPGGITAFPRESPEVVLAEIALLQKQVTADTEALMGTSSFLDRLRGTGPLTPARAREHGALGPIGKASGYADDARLARPYDAYPLLAAEPARQHSGGDAMTRLLVRFEEVAAAFRLIRQALIDFPERGRLTPRTPCDPLDGRATGWAEAPQGEVLYDVTIEGGRIARCQPRSASFHNLVLMHEVFAGDILTDFPFIEASFGLSAAGAAL
jgi:Ni,Fe-hydrogenase III large subunit